MFKRSGFSIYTLISFLIIFCMSLAGCTEDEKANVPISDENTYKFFIASDTHYFSKKLYDNNETFQTFESNGDGKIIGYSHEIAEAFVNDALQQKPNAVILTGDLTLNGEKTSHTDLAKALKEIKNAGIQVLVIPGNHDINNPYAREIKNGRFRKTDHVTPEEFAKIYGEYGYNDALTRDAYSLSYMSELNSNLFALMLDTCIYDTNIEINLSNGGGMIREGTMEWIQDSIDFVKSQNKNAEIITIMHHNLFVHNRYFESNYTVHFADAIQNMFNEMDLSLFFSGHIHLQDILTKDVANRPMTEIVTGALVAYPIAYGVTEVSGGVLNYYTQPVNVEAYAQSKNIDDENLLNIEEYSKAKFNERSSKRVEEVLRGMNYSDEDTQKAIDVLKKINTYYFAGNIDLVANEIFHSRGYEILTGNILSKSYLESVFEDGSGENNMFTTVLY